MVALLVAPSLGAQDRWEDRDRNGTSDVLDRMRVDRREAEMRRDAERRLFTWRGPVDDETRIYIRAADIKSYVVTGRETRRRTSVDRNRPLPRRDGYVRVELLEGRGRVHVIQQPSARNNYTAIVRVKDAQAGAASYRFAAYFDPTDDYRRDGRDGRVWDDIDGDVGTGSRVLRWSGSVDGDLRIVMRPGSLVYDVVSGEPPRGISASGARSVPRRNGMLDVTMRQGRGFVSVVQQPTSYNNYTAIVRVFDRDGGYGYYDFDLIWR